MFDTEPMVRQAAVESLDAIRLNLAAFTGRNSRVSALAVSVKRPTLVYAGTESLGFETRYDGVLT